MNMKILLAIFSVVLLASFSAEAQSVLISNNSSSTTPDASAILEVESTSSAFLMTRLTKAEIQAIALPAAGLMLYNTDDKKPVYYDGSDWLFFDGTLVVFSKKKSTEVDGEEPLELSDMRRQEETISDEKRQ